MEEKENSFEENSEDKDSGSENNSEEETVTKLLPVKSDFVFKLIFGDQRNVDILAAFLKTVLKIPDEEFDHITIIDPHIKKESLNDKYGILDVKIHLKGGRVVQVEIQVEKIPDMEQRTVYGQSKMIIAHMFHGVARYVINPHNNGILDFYRCAILRYFSPYCVMICNKFATKNASKTACCKFSLKPA